MKKDKVDVVSIFNKKKEKNKTLDRIKERKVETGSFFFLEGLEVSCFSCFGFLGERVTNVKQM